MGDTPVPVDSTLPQSSKWYWPRYSARTISSCVRAIAKAVLWEHGWKLWLLPIIHMSFVFVKEQLLHDSEKRKKKQRVTVEVQ